MRQNLLKVLTLVLLIGLSASAPANTTENGEKKEDQPLDHSYAEDILQSFEKPLNEWKSKKRVAEWNYETNLTDFNLQEKLKVWESQGDYMKTVRNQINQLKWHGLQDKNLERQFCKLSFIGTAILPEKPLKETEEILCKAEKLYNTLTICDFKDPKNCNLTLFGNLTGIMATSRDPEELKHIWKSWHDVCGKAIVPDFPRYVEILTEAAKLLNISDYTVAWLRDYESEKFTEEIDALWQEVKPLYVQLHAYVRRLLRKQYGDNLVAKDQPIPAHLLGDMWAQRWHNVANFTAPFADKKPIDVSDEMIKQNYNIEKMYKVAEERFVSIGLEKLPETFWQKSIFQKPADRAIVCDSPVFDFNDGKDYRVSKCMNVSMEYLRQAHDQVGAIEYSMQYKGQRYAYKNPPNPGFAEAIGDLLSLSVETPAHLEKLGLLKANSTDSEVLLNNLYYKAMDRVANLPFAYVTEKWRWDVFQNKINKKQYNCHWWKLSEDIQGVKPPVERSDSDFDAGAEYHIAVDYTYLRYFVSTILQFQLHKNLCTEIGEYKPNDPTKPLHLCDITSSTQAGEKLKAGMQLGSSKPWQEVLEKITGETKMSASGLLEYFKPLHEWLKADNEKNKETIGWSKTQKDC